MTTMSVPMMEITPSELLREAKLVIFITFDYEMLFFFNFLLFSRQKLP